MTEKTNSSPSATRPKGLMLFAPGTSATHRRRRRIFVLAELVIGAMVLWPLFAWPGVTPLIFGLPRSLVWLTSSVLLSFAMLLWLYHGDRDDVREQSPTGKED